jgi:hypothetical protein
MTDAIEDTIARLSAEGFSLAQQGRAVQGSQFAYLETGRERGEMVELIERSPAHGGDIPPHPRRRTELGRSDAHRPVYLRLRRRAERRSRHRRSWQGPGSFPRLIRRTCSAAPIRNTTRYFASAVIPRCDPRSSAMTVWNIPNGVIPNTRVSLAAPTAGFRIR